MRIEIAKKSKTLNVYHDDGQRIKSFDVAFGTATRGRKEIEGDSKTPEGEYAIGVKNPKSKFHLSLGLNYPNIADADRGLAANLITRGEHDSIVEANLNEKLPPQNTALGGEIYIHGGGTEADWTRGCIALTDAEMTELFEMAEIGTRVSIRQ
ncbi:MAG: L,D-transpeptidase [Acidobacteriota bacterium]